MINYLVSLIAGGRMRKLFLVFAVSIVLIMAQFSCSSGNNVNTGPSPSDNPGTGNTDYPSPAWYTEISAASSPNWVFPTLSVPHSLIETDDYYAVIISTYDPLKSTILAIEKGTGKTRANNIDGYYVTGMTEDPDSNLLTFNQTGLTQPYTGNITVFSSTGEKLKEVAHPDVIMRNAFATCDDGVVFTYWKSDNTPVLAKTDFDGNIVWEKQYANALDSSLTGTEYITPRDICAIRKDVDGNLIVAQSIRKYGSSESEQKDVGYAVYMVTPAGGLVWSKAHYKGISDWQDSVNAVDMVVLQDGTIVVEWHLGYSEPGGSMIVLEYLDNQGDSIRQLHAFDRSGAGSMCLSADQKVIYVCRASDYGTNAVGTVMYKFDLDGTLIWNQSYYEDRFSDPYDRPYPIGVYLCSDGGFMVPATVSTDTANLTGIVFIKTDANGNQTSNPDI
jgi:hypothetical protein